MAMHALHKFWLKRSGRMRGVTRATPTTGRCATSRAGSPCLYAASRPVQRDDRAGRRKAYLKARLARNSER